MLMKSPLAQRQLRMYHIHSSKANSYLRRISSNFVFEHTLHTVRSNTCLWRLDGTIFGNNADDFPNQRIAIKMYRIVRTLVVLFCIAAPYAPLATAQKETADAPTETVRALDNLERELGRKLNAAQENYRRSVDSVTKNKRFDDEERQRRLLELEVEYLNKVAEIEQNAAEKEAEILDKFAESGERGLPSDRDERERPRGDFDIDEREIGDDRDEEDEDRRGVENEIAELAVEREKELLEASTEHEREVADLEREGMDEDKYLEKRDELDGRLEEKINRIENRFARKERSILEKAGQRTSGSNAYGPVHDSYEHEGEFESFENEWRELHAEHEREVLKIQEEFDRELDAANREAEREGKPEKLDKKRRDLERKFDKKMTQLERKFAKKVEKLQRKEDKLRRKSDY